MGGASEQFNDESLSGSKKTKIEMKDLERNANGDGIAVPEGGITPLLITMSSIAEKRGKSIAQVALNYIVSKGAIPIPGCRTVSQLEDNLGAMGWRLSDTEIKMLSLKLINLVLALMEQASSERAKNSLAMELKSGVWNRLEFKSGVWNILG